jgi:Uma2 family endonuclease
MEAIAAEKIKLKKTTLNGANTTKQVTWEEFQRRYLNRENSFKYEWVNGEVVKTKRTKCFILKVR